MIPGQRDSAIEMLRAGSVVGVLPGGTEEAMLGGKSRYTLHPLWDKRRGFVEVAKEARVKIVPALVRNAEEMRFNPVFYLWSLTGLGRHFEVFVNQGEKSAVKRVVKMAGIAAWYIFSWCNIIVPVKLDFVIAPAVNIDYDRDSVDEIALKCKEAVQKLLSDNQPGGVDYYRGVRENIEYWQQCFALQRDKKKL